MSLTGRTSMVPNRPDGNFEATWIASFRSRAVVPRLKCRQGERVRKDAGNTVKSVQNDRGGRRPWICYGRASEYYHMLLWSEASEATEFFTKRMVTNEKICVHKLSGAVHQHDSTDRASLAFKKCSLPRLRFPTLARFRPPALRGAERTNWRVGNCGSKRRTSSRAKWPCPAWAWREKSIG